MSRREKTCSECGTTFTGNCRVRNGERFCRDCEPLAPGKGQPVEPSAPQTAEEYQARKATTVPVSALMDGGQVR